MLRTGRTLFWVLATGLGVLVLATLRQLPPIVALHFDGAGVPNGWSSRAVYAAVVIAVGVLLPLGITGLITALTLGGPERLNIPARDYWARPERSHEAVRRVRAYMWWLSCILTGTALTLHGLVVAANADQPPRLNTVGAIILLGAALLAIGAWIAGWYRLLRRPRAD